MKRQGARLVYSVADVARAIWRRFEDIPQVWMEGEITNLNRGGGQMYFTICDVGGGEPFALPASMNAIVFDRLPFRPADGSLVQAHGRAEFWPQRGQIRVRVERLELAGEGLLLVRIEELKRRLAAEGLMADERKRRLPFLPRRIGLVTSGEGAARVDFLRNLAARFPAASVVVVRTPVQGDQAPAEIARALRFLDADPDVEVIVVARGGGSLEDLMAFNSELVCRAVAGCSTAVVSAVGHERDVTLCDLVADLRVSTPTKAAEHVVPDARELDARLDAYAGALARVLRRVGERSRERLVSESRRLEPAVRRLVRERAPERLERHAEGLSRAIGGAGARAANDLDRSEALLALLSPRRTLARGYAIAWRGDRVVPDTESAVLGGLLELEFRDGRVRVTVGESE